MSRSSSSSHKLCPSFLVAALIFSVFTLTGIVSAAWVDAPNVPPGYGASGCSPYPCLEMDFKPFNLGSTAQTKQAGATFVGDITADMFADRQNPLAYYIDPSGNGGISAMLSGDVHINNSIPGGAKFVVNNPSDDTKTGLPNDAIYAYGNNAGASALFAEQGDPLGYAIYASGTTSHFETNVEVGSATNPKQLCLSGVCQSTWPSAGSGTTNTITKWTGSNALGNSIITDNGTTVTVGGNLSVSGTANTCKKVSYTAVEEPGSPTASCGTNYYIVNVMNGDGTFADPNFPPQSGFLLCCKNAD